MAIVNQVPATADKKIIFGMAFPFQPGATSFPKRSVPEKKTFFHIVSLVLTGKGERVMHPDLGVNAYDFVFENLTPITIARLSSAISRAIEQWVPEAKVLSLIPTVESNEDNTNTWLLLDIQYRIANQDESAQVPVLLTKAA